MEPSPFIQQPHTPWWHWALATTALIIIVVSTLFIFKKRRHTTQKKSPLHTAQSALQSLKEKTQPQTQTQTNPPSPTTIATRTSIILRQYLEQTLEDPALFETDEEFTLRANTLKNLPKKTQQKVHTFLHHLAHTKYTPLPDTKHTPNESATLIDQALELLIRIDQAHHRRNQNHSSSNSP